MSRKRFNPASDRQMAAVDQSFTIDDAIDDPDNPEWTEEVFARARGPESLPDHVLAAFPNTKVRGRPRSANPKVQISIRLEPDVLDGLRAQGPGWQRLANEMLRDGLRRRKRRA